MLQNDLINNNFQGPYQEKDNGIDLSNFLAQEEIAKFESIKPQGWTIIVRLYTKPKIINGIYQPDTVHDEQQYRSCTGLVVAKSKASYKDPQYSDTGHWCEVGDWVVFPRHAGYKIQFDGLPTYILKEDAIDAIVEDPSKITR